MTIRWPLTKLALMIVIATWVVTWGDNPTPISSSFMIPASPMALSDGTGDFL